jgi:DNA topoisomerase I
MLHVLGWHSRRWCPPSILRVPAAVSRSQWQSTAAVKTTLVIVESPAKAKLIQQFLNDLSITTGSDSSSDSGSCGERFIVDSCSGHINDLASRPEHVPARCHGQLVHPSVPVRITSLGVDVHNRFEPFYVMDADKQALLERLVATSQTVDRVVLATDEDREGEAIAWFLSDALQSPGIPHQRAVFHEITPAAIANAFRNLREIDMNMVKAQESRRILDKLAGFTLSPLLWR